MDLREAARARARLAAAVRGHLGARGWLEVETPCLVPSPGMEPHVAAFETRFLPEGGGPGQPLWLHTSPEYAMKRLLARGLPRIFQLARVFRNGELGAHHNPEFTMLELYRAGTDYRGIMEDLEALVGGCALELCAGHGVCGPAGALDLSPPFERLSVAEVFRARAGVDLAACQGRAERLAEAARAAGLDPGRPGDSFDDLFFRIFLERIEPGLGAARPVYLVDWPAPLAALARLKPGDPLVAERFELYAGGLELANGFSELTDAAEQRRRLLSEREERRRLGRPLHPVDERFLEDLSRMPAAGGVALGFDRLLMLLAGARTIEEVLLFPAAGLLAPGGTS
ncbi:MAG TPA: EF-P lysine aminoacylase EpmA [Anaeromyxobacteraceae bacterium]|nr:EF-P lysine aminoacylase EpmA [Anaeromyxobacteraceae bacterium]